jgi:hypothetical protein
MKIGLVDLCSVWNRELRGVMVRVVYFAIVLLHASSATAGPAECQAATGEHEAARLEAASRVRPYLSCINSGDKSNECSAEFLMLEDAQDNVESTTEKRNAACK